MGLFNRLFRGRAAAEQLDLAIPRWKGSPRWADISSAGAEAASEAIRVAGGGSYMDVISSMRQGYEQGRRSKAWRGRDINDVLQMLARRATGAAPARAGFDTVDDLRGMKMFESETWQAAPPWKPVMSGKSPLTEPGTRLKARAGLAKYRGWVRAHRAHIEAGAAAAGIGKREATSRAWSAFKENPVPASQVPSLIRAAILGGHMESPMATVRKPSKSTYAARFAGKATAAQNKAINEYNAQQRAKKAGKPASSKRKASSSKRKASGSGKTMNFPANICTPAGRVRKPTKAVYARFFKKEATAAEKRHVIAYNAWKRAGSPPATTKAGMSKRKASGSKRKASKSKASKSKSRTSSGKLRKPSKSTYAARFAGKATKAQNKAINAYNAQQRAAKKGKPASSKRKASSAKPAPVRKAASAASAAATVVKAHQSGKPLASAKTMNRKAFMGKYGAEIKKAIGAAKGVNYFSAAKVAHEAFDRAPQGQKTKAIGLAIKAAKKAGVFKKGAASAPKKRKSASPKRRKSSTSKRRSSGSQRFKVAGSVTVTAA